MKRPVRIAFFGVDGSGKTETRKKFEKWLKDKNKKVGTIVAPAYSTSRPPAKNIGKILSKISDIGARKKSRRIIAASSLGSAFLYSFLKISTAKGKDILLIERHPTIEAKALGEFYKFRKALPITKFVAGSLNPDIGVFLECDEKKAYERIKRRPEKQLHEDIETLRKMNEKIPENS